MSILAVGSPMRPQTLTQTDQIIQKSSLQTGQAIRSFTRVLELPLDRRSLDSYACGDRLEFLRRARRDDAEADPVAGPGYLLNIAIASPRVLALAFIPALAIGVLAINAALAMNLQPRPGQEGMVLPGLIGTGLLFLVVQRLHFWLVDKTLRRRDS